MVIAMGKRKSNSIEKDSAPAKVSKKQKVEQPTKKFSKNDKQPAKKIAKGNDTEVPKQKFKGEKLDKKFSKSDKKSSKKIGKETDAETPKQNLNKTLSNSDNQPCKTTSKESDAEAPKQQFKHFQRGNKSKFPNNKSEKPADWNEFKKKKKELRLKRKESNSLFTIIIKAKQIGETLRRKTLKGGKEERDKLVGELHQLLGNQGNYVKFVLAHDMARIVQYMLKFGNERIRNEIADEIIPSVVQMLESKYGRYCVKRLFKSGNAKTRSAAIKMMYGNAIKLSSRGVSARVFEYIYSTWTQPLEKMHLIQEFFGDLYKQTKDDNVRHLRDTYKESPEMKAAALGAVKANLSRVLNKDLLDSGLIQSVLYQYLTECSDNDRIELVSQLSPHAVILSNSKDGSRAVMECIWHGTNKDRKVIMKALKEHALDLSKHEYGHTVLISILDAIDDTVLVNKTITAELVKNILEIAKDEWGRKVILWLVAPGNSTHFHPVFTKELEQGREKSNSKKSSDIRQKEILGYTIEPLLNSIQAEPNSWFDNASISVVALAILKSGSGAVLSKSLEQVAKIITCNDWKIKNEKEDVLGIEHAGLHMTLKKLIQNDKEAAANGRPTFSEALLNHLEEDVIKSWISTNRGCFLLVTVLENGGENVCAKLKETLKDYVKLIKKEKTAAAKILLKKLD